MQKILVLNAKGGSGKTTIATNLAAFYASRGHFPALLDYDSQGSALNWLHMRSEKMPAIHGVEAHKRSTAVTRSWQMRMPPKIDRVIIDTPAAVEGPKLVDYVREANTIIIPVLPSPIDIHATTQFIKDIVIMGKMGTALTSKNPGKNAVRIGVVANRVMENTKVYKSLENFLRGLDLPLITAIGDSQYYIHAFVEGLGIHELRDSRTQYLCQQWLPLLDWIDNHPNPTQMSKSPHSIKAFM